MTIVSDRPVVRRGLLIVAALVLVGARVALGIGAWNPGSSALTWDDFTRVAQARAWAVDPVLVPDLVWLPLHTWVLGSAFMLFGDFFEQSPMALAAVVHTIALIASAAVVGRTAMLLLSPTAVWEVRVGGGEPRREIVTGLSPTSAMGGLLVFAAMLFSPWGFYLSLSGLGETLYYLAVAVAFYGVVQWTRKRSLGSLVVAAIGISAGCALRYEGWWLAVSWAGVLLFTEMRTRGLRNIPVGVWLAAGAPFLVPAAWMAVNLNLTGSPIFFATESARYFLSAYGALESIRARVLYYPLSLLRSAPLLVSGLVALLFINRANPVVRRLGLVTGIHLVLFYATSLVSSAVGAFNERFMFAFVVALLPVLSTVPELLARIPSLNIRRLVTTGMLLVAVSLTTVRLADRPIEWTHSPDLLSLIELLGEAAPADRPLGIVIDPRMAGVESIPMVTTHGVKLKVVSADDLAIVSPHQLPPGWDVYVSRLPELGDPIDPPSEVMIGRYGLWGPLVDRIEVNAASCPCSGWAITDENGRVRPLAVGPYNWIEFTGNDPAPGAEAVVATELSLPANADAVAVEVRSLYGHGFNPGRVRVEVRVADVTVESWDLAEPSRWRTVRIEVPAGTSKLDLEVAVVAQPNLEPNWAWGRVSTVLVGSVEVYP